MSYDSPEDIPRLGDGWNDPDELVKAALDTGDQVPTHYSDASDLLNWVEDNLVVAEDDLTRLERETRRNEWRYCDKCGDEYEIRCWVDEEPATHREDADTRYTGIFAAWCDEHVNDGEYFSFEETWYE